MATKTYNNNIDEVEVSLAIEQVLVATVEQSWTAGRVNMDSLPTGFRSLGAVVEDSPQLTISREKFQLQVGLPRVLQYEALIGVGGNFQVQLHSNSWRKLQFALGNYDAVSTPTAVTSIASVTNRTTITLATTSGSLPVGRQIWIASSTVTADYADAIETRVVSIAANGLDYYLSPTPAKTPTDGHYVGYYSNVIQYFGSNKIKQYQILGVADFTDGVQVIHHLYKAVPADEFVEAIRPTENGRIPLSMNLLGVSQSVQGEDQLVVGRRIYIPAGA